MRAGSATTKGVPLVLGHCRVRVVRGAPARVSPLAVPQPLVCPPPPLFFPLSHFLSALSRSPLLTLSHSLFSLSFLSFSVLSRSLSRTLSLYRSLYHRDHFPAQSIMGFVEAHVDQMGSSSGTWALPRPCGFISENKF